MIAAISLMRRQERITLGGFRRHWLDVHGPLVCAFAGLRAYAQCHPVASPAMNARALAYRVDGFPILFFDNDADRGKAHGSPEMAACNVDSRHFVGAVSRVIADVETLVPAGSSVGRVGVLALYPDPADAALVAEDAARMADLPGVEALARYYVREQGAAPASTIPHLPIAVGAGLQARFGSLVDLEWALEAWEHTTAARFVVEEHWLV
jgi:uncharacterized protein (TIGR02118 family)